jgi:hypothetical protein
MNVQKCDYEAENNSRLLNLPNNAVFFGEPSQVTDISESASKVLNFS